MEQRFFYDGKTLTLYNPKEKVYASEAAPATVEKMIDFARESVGILLPAADLLYRNAFPQHDAGRESGRGGRQVGHRRGENAITCCSAARVSISRFGSPRIKDCYRASTWSRRWIRPHGLASARFSSTGRLMLSWTIPSSSSRRPRAPARPNSFGLRSLANQAAEIYRRRSWTRSAGCQAHSSHFFSFAPFWLQKRRHSGGVGRPLPSGPPSDLQIHRHPRHPKPTSRQPSSRRPRPSNGQRMKGGGLMQPRPTPQQPGSRHLPQGPCRWEPSSHRFRQDARPPHRAALHTIAAVGTPTRPCMKEAL